MIAAGSFREDLYYRLAEIVVRIPSLAERHGDAALLAKHFLARFAREMNPQVKGFAPGALAAIENWPWPGNVRELENRMKRAVIMADGKLITAEDLDLEAAARGQPAGQPQGRARDRRPPGDPQGAGADRRQYFERRQAARDQPADALRPAQAIRPAGVRTSAAPLLALACWLLLGAARRAPTGRPAEAGTDALSQRGARPRLRASARGGDIRTARVELLNALQADPNNTAARIMQARVASRARRRRRRRSAEIARARQSGATRRRRPRICSPMRGCCRATRRARCARRRRPAPAHRAYAAADRRPRLYGARRRRSNAGAAFDRALAAAPNDSDVWTDIARFRRSNGDIAGAIEAADRAVAARPRNAEALTLRGELTRGQYGLAAAMPWFDRALEIDPGNVAALLERAATYGDMGRMSDMLADARKVLTPHRRPSARLSISRRCSPRARRNFELARTALEPHRRRL